MLKIKELFQRLKPEPKPRETYRIKASCGNCKWSGDMDATKGVSMFYTTCPYCDNGNCLHAEGIAETTGGEINV